MIPFIAIDEPIQISWIATVIAEPRQSVQDLVFATERYEIDLAERGNNASCQLS